MSGIAGHPDIRQRDEEFETEKHLTKAELLEMLRATMEEVVAVLKTLDAASMLEQRTIQGCDVDVLQSVFHVTEHFSMHTGQIILLTKMLSETDLGFYKFTNGVPDFRW